MLTLLHTRNSYIFATGYGCFLPSMKANKILLFYAILTVHIGYAQFSGSEYPGAFITGNGGYSLPLASFSSTAANNWTGYAQGGSAFNIKVGIPFKHSNYGVSLLAGANNNGYDANSYGSNLAKTDSNNKYSTVTATSYSQYYLMGGVLLMSNSNDGLSFNFRADIGVMYVNYPDPYWSTTANSSGVMETWYQNTNSSTTFAFDIGGGLIYAFPSGFALAAGVDFLHTGVSCSTTELNNTSSTQISTTSTNSLSITSLNLTVGLGYSF